MALYEELCQKWDAHPTGAFGSPFGRVKDSYNQNWELAYRGESTYTYMYEWDDFFRQPYAADYKNNPNRMKEWISAYVFRRP